ncbi:interferon regulatory factor 6-like [Corticium candelabrum]|uniref:interferon regulatory factor 6-like n=1 Tax=Corticium candelabrum TaxID=121492 RepID=UPI002E257C3A|nr:interferon regulatory factor 6-like [Corticium candelabrum]XP_062506104.1 interferon regulatory factor 6-like [Corticium candelabrum]XP_062506105.1 interferon regulatory factor 6-like [Corticium candelabrum]
MQEAGERFVCWLYNKVEEDSIPGVIWVNKRDLLCQIPWQRGSRKSLTGGSITRLLEAWADFCGRGQEPDLRTCMKEVNYAVQNLEGWLRTVKVDEIEGYRLLQFDRNALRSVIQARDTGETQNGLTCTAVEEAEESLEESSRSSLEFRLQTVPCQEEHHRRKRTRQPLPSLKTALSKKVSRVNSPVAENECPEESKLLRLPTPLGDRHTHVKSPPDSQISDMLRPSGMEVIVFYFNREVARHYIRDAVGCLLYYNQHSQPKYHTCGDSLVYIALPNPDTGFGTPSLKRLLQSMQLGVLIEMRNNDIFAKQLGFCSVYCNDTRYETHSEGKIRRLDGTRVYDFQLFCSHFESHCNGQGGCPSTEIYMTFGQAWNCHRSSEENLLSVAVIHCLARTRVQELSPHRPGAEIIETVELEIDEKTDEDDQIELRFGVQLPEQ